VRHSGGWWWRLERGASRWCVLHWRCAHTGAAVSEARRWRHGPPAPQRPGAPPTPAHLLCVFTKVEDGGARHRLALTAVRCIGTPLWDVDDGFLLSSLDDGGHLPRQRRLLPLNGDHRLPPLCMANGGLFLAQRLDLGLPGSDLGCGFFFQKKIFAVLATTKITKRLFFASDKSYRLSQLIQ
jgi:hypothetical protein